MYAWFKFFRVVNLPTVPGDVFAGAAAFAFATNCYAPALVAWAGLASTLLYMFGLADNDIVGAKSDAGRPIPDGEISLVAARIARALCLAGALVIAQVAPLPFEWYESAALLVLMIVVYNRTKIALFMGCCRGFNVGCGFAVAYGVADVLSLDWWRWCPPLLVAAIFTLYIAAVTKYSEGEETDPRRKRRVGLLIGSHIYLQLVALMVFAWFVPSTMPLLVMGAAMLIALRILKRSFTEVSAS